MTAPAWKDKVTKGPWCAEDYCATDEGCGVIASGADGGLITPTRGLVAFCTSVAGASFQSPELCEANARLIAEAGTVLHESGFTPRELLEQVALEKISVEEYRAELTAANEALRLTEEQRDGLLAALKAMLSCWRSVCAGQGWDPDHVTEATKAETAIAACDAKSLEANNG